MSGAAYVQSNFNTAVGTTTVTLTGVVTGNTLLVGIYSLATGLTFTAGDTVNTYASAVRLNSATSCSAQWFSAKNVTGGSLTVTVTPSASDTTTVMFVEVSGADHTTPIQNTDSAAGTSASILGNSITTSGANIYAIQLTGSFSPGIAANTQSSNSPWGADRQNTASFTGGGGRASVAIADQSVATTGTSVQASATDSRSTGNWIVLTLLLNNTATAVYGQQAGAFLVGL